MSSRNLAIDKLSDLGRFRNIGIGIPSAAISLLLIFIWFIETHYGLDSNSRNLLHILTLAFVLAGAYFFSSFIFRMVKRYQEALLKSRDEQAAAEGALRGLFNGVPLGLFRSTPDGRILDANPALVQILGYPDRQALLRVSAPSLYVDLAHRRNWQEIVERDGVVRDFELPLRRYDGTVILVRLSVRLELDPDGRKSHYEGVVEDITDRKRVEDTLRKLSRALEETADAVYITDRNGVIEYVNPAFEKLTGYTLAEARGQTPRILKSGAHKQGYYEALWEWILSGRIFRGDIRNKRKDGSLYYYDLTITPVRDGAGPITHFVATGRDATERVRSREQEQQHEEALRALAARLQSVREEERSRIAREIHDELGQQLTALKIDLAWLTGRLPEKQTDLRARTAMMLGLLDTTIQSVRRIATELRPGVLDDLGLVAAIEWQAQEFEGRTGIPCRLTSSVTDRRLSPKLSTAMFRICQEALTNVARHAQATEVRIRLAEEGGNLTLTVQDNGRGITNLEISDRRSLGILGMQERAHELGGGVGVGGALGHGTSIRAEVPLNPADGANAPAGSRSEMRISNPGTSS